MAGESAHLVFTDPPYNVPIDGHVCGLGRVRHREFAMGAGEMTSPQFIAFLAETLGAMAASCRDGAIAFVCMDWRHMSELLTAGQKIFSELKNLCVWNKTNGGMGTFYRSKTVKPVALVADAIRDCSRRGEIVLDGFGGSGTTLMAAQSCGRLARLIEIDPCYCDVIIRRFEAATGKRARCIETGLSFEETQAQWAGAGQA